MSQTPRKLIDLKPELQEIKLNELNTAGRSRKEYGNVADLALSIEQKGLINPIAVMKYDEPYQGFNYFLLAGGRRTEAFKKLKRETIPARVYPSLNGYEIRAVELEENIRRKDLTDAERMLMVKQVHDLYVSTYGEKTSTVPGAAGHSKRDTAKMLGRSPASVTRDLELAGYLEKIPELAKLGDSAAIKRAIKQARRTVQVNNDLAKLETKPEKGSNKDKLIKSYLVGDFFERIKQVPDGVIHFIDHDIDFPMDMSEQHTRQSDERDQQVYSTITKKEYPKLMQESLQECYRVLAENSWIIIWFGYEYFTQIQKWAKEAGFRTSFYHGKWYKGRNMGHTMNPSYTLNHTVEPFFYFKKGSPSTNHSHDDVFECPPLSPTAKDHPFEKPISLTNEIFSVFGTAGGRVLVPFAGAGRMMISAWKKGCHVIGIDKSQQYRDAFEAHVRNKVNE